MEFHGGTYINQIESEDLLTAIDCWTKKLDVTKTKYLGELGKRKLLESVKDFDPVNIIGALNVWFFCLTIPTGFVKVHVIKTSSRSEPALH
jgi:hypothetical protein